jgi:hypothetical protein
MNRSCQLNLFKMGYLEITVAILYRKILQTLKKASPLRINPGL